MRLYVYSGKLILAKTNPWRVGIDGRYDVVACSADVRGIGFMCAVASNTSRRYTFDELESITVATRRTARQICIVPNLTRPLAAK